MKETGLTIDSILRDQNIDEYDERAPGLYAEEYDRYSRGWSSRLANTPTASL